MYVPKHWLFLFGLSCTFGVALLWLYTQNALLNAEVSSLERDIVALDVDASSLADDVRQLEYAVAELRSTANGDDPAAAIPAALTGRHGIAAGATDPLASDASIVVDELQAIANELRAAQTPQVVVVNADDMCTYADGDQQAAQGNGDSDDSDDSGDSSSGSESSIEANNEIGNYATNSGNIIDSFFLDGGQGDVGLNIVESVLNGVNISIVHQSGENSLTDSANTTAGPVTGNNPSNDNSPSFSGNEISAPVSVSGTVDSSNAIGDGTDTAAPGSSANHTLVATEQQAVTSNGPWTIGTPEPPEEPTAVDAGSADAPTPPAEPAPVPGGDLASDHIGDSSNPAADTGSGDQDADVVPATTPTATPVALSDDAAETPSDE